MLLALFIVSVIALMILPLPTLLIDTLVAANIALGIMLIMMSIYVSSPLQFSAFPSVILISTLFRLALSVATTRMILLEGDAGNIIDTFGVLVAGGNIVVGLVVFLIITLVQFLVIAKGSERVAEVGARFTLDAMPGKQLSIDSDLRSGLIDKAEARQKRSDLEMESQLHGSLDGAMKFVKGDAIAGIVIIIVNLLGGLAVGVFQLGMSSGSAMQKYSILTIGDGLVAQIPALFAAMSAGLIVTRVSRQGSTEHLGESIQRQFSSIPRVILVAGGMCLFFAAIPGFPTGVFLSFGLLMMGGGCLLSPDLKNTLFRLFRPTFNKVLHRQGTEHHSHISKTGSVEGYVNAPLLLNLPAPIIANGGDNAIRSILELKLTEHYRASGIRLPKVHFNWHRQERAEWWLDIHGVPVCTEQWEAGRTDAQEIASSVVVAIRRNIRLFVGLEESSQLLNRSSETHPEVVREVQRALPLQGIAVIIRNLAEEEVPLQNVSVALEAVAEASHNDKDLMNLTEYARIALGRQICHKYARQSVLQAVCLANELEEMLLKELRVNASGSELNLSAQYAQSLQDQLGSILDQQSPLVVVVPVSLRPHLRKLIAERYFDVPVLSYQEIVKPFHLSIVDKIRGYPEAVSSLGTARSGAA